MGFIAQQFTRFFIQLPRTWYQLSYHGSQAHLLTNRKSKKISNNCDRISSISWLKLTPCKILPSGCTCSSAFAVREAIWYRSGSKLGCDIISSFTHLTKVVTASMKLNRILSSSSFNWGGLLHICNCVLDCDCDALLIVEVDWVMVLNVLRCFSSHALNEVSSA